MKLFRLLAFVILLAFLLVAAGPLLSQTSYVVQRGDTLSAIARRYGITVQEIATANNIVNPDLIFAGQTLIIPGQDESPAETPPVEPPVNSSTYVVQPGDTLFRIALTQGVSIAALVQANDITNINLIYAGQVLIIPGTSQVQPTPVPSQPTPPPTPQPSQPTPVPQPTPTAAPPPSPVGVNLLPNASFEEGYYHLNGIPELQVPNSWQLNFDEGQGAPGTGVTLLRPESRAIPRWLLPPHEHSIFIWQGDWTIKVFKGGAPFSVRYFTDVNLQPGTYQFTANYFPDLVAGYSGGQKIYTSQYAAGEVAFIKDGVGGWQIVTPGTRNSLVQTFTVPTESTVRVGVAFRTRYVLSNNGFFFDDWSLQRLPD